MSVVKSASSPVRRPRDSDEAVSTSVTDASDPGEFKFEEPVSGLSQLKRRGSRIIDSDEDEVMVEAQSETEEEEVVPRRRVVRRFAGSDEEVPAAGGRARGSGARRIVSGKEVEVASGDSEDEEIMSAKRAGKRKAIALSLTPTSEDEEDLRKKRSGRLVRRKDEPEQEESEEEDILDGLDEDGESLGVFKILGRLRN